MPSSQSRRARRRRAQTDSNAQPPKQPYLYSRLPNKTTIRVLELLTSPEEEIQCTLRVVDLDDSPVFDALSYSWANPITIREKAIPPGEDGAKMTDSLLSLHRIPTTRYPTVINVDPGTMAFLSVHGSLPYMDRKHGRDRCKSIICDGKTMRITETLFSALLQLRWMVLSKSQMEEQGETYVETLPTPRSKQIWIDQICIDQEHTAERSAQIPLMNKIFASAQYVFAWIGDLDALGTAGLDVVLARGLTPLSGDQSIDSDISYESLGKARKNLYALAALLSRQWFRRAWVVQEAVFARRLYLWSGPIFIDWWILLSTLQTLTEADTTRMARIMSSLIRREPTGRMSRKLARMKNKHDAQELLVAAVTDEEILGIVQGAISFMKGVVQIKEQLGLQYFDAHVTKGLQLLDAQLESRFPSLIIGMGLKPSTQNQGQGIFLHNNTRSQHLPRMPDLADRHFDHFSAAFTDAPVNSEDATGDARINASFYNHSLKPTKYSASSSISLFSLITRFRDVGASDPRDKVFAFLHLATETPGLKPDYRASVQTVFIGAARLLLDRHNLTVLSHVQDPSDTNVLGLPSWVPDFSVPLGRTPFVAHDGASPYSASGKHSSQPNFYLVVGDEREKTTSLIMAAHGYFLDTVADLADPKGCYFTRTGSLALKIAKHYVQEPSPAYIHKSRLFLRLAHTPRPTRVEALWRTLVADYCSDTYPAPVTTGFGFSDWVSVHSHHAIHVYSMLNEHFDAVTTPAAAMLALQATQKRKQDVYVALHADDPGGYLCIDCTREFWMEKLQDFDKGYTKLLDDSNLVPECNPVRYMPDSDRIRALQECAHSSQGRSDPEAALNCPFLTPTEFAHMTAFENRMRDVKKGRRMFRTKGDLLGLGPKSVQEGDEVWVVLGTKVPFVLRPVDGGREPKRYRLIGEAFVLGYMDGEVFSEDRKLQTFGLV